MQPAQPKVIICGAGVIGAAIAYYLTLRGVAPVVVERCGVACAASGKAGGFLALDWCDNSPLGALARTSFALHADLAAVFPNRYGYRGLRTVAVAAPTEGRQRRVAQHQELAWLDGACTPYANLGTPETTAQVHPAQFTQTLLQAACEQGARVQMGCVDGLDVRHGRVHGVRVDGQALAADAVVLAMGPWANVAAQWLPLPSVWGLKGHSMTLRPTTPVPAQALFVDYVTRTGERLAPEVYPRPDGEVYLCGVSAEVPVPERPEDVQPHPEAIALLQEIARTLSSTFAGLQPLRMQACYRPVTEDGLPLLGPVPGVTGAYVATGHSCWGILNAPASGLAMAELLVDGHARTVDLAPFALQRVLTAR